MEGIESPELLEEGAVNYWQAAWDARTYFEKRARRPVPRDDIAMAINSKASRSQRQLHIHIDCVRPDVRAVLKAREGEIGAAWATLRPFPGGAVVKARRLDGAALAPRNPFALLADGDAEARADMGRFTLVVVGAVFADGTPGFILLETGVPPAFGEGLLDHACAVLREP
jgi:CDP-diacylglycerol pyrophosphatase